MILLVYIQTQKIISFYHSVSQHSSDNESEILKKKSKMKGRSRRRTPSPIVFDKSPGSRSDSKSPLGYGGVSSTDGEISDSEDDKPALKSAIVQSASKPAVKDNSVEPPSPSRSGR